ncbi:MAG: outer membrane protein assembly factor BamA [Deltaproteobacteria bacterium]|nr:outer membrane protein assembly factor BamA [Deltaproteobacteria bacterium]
MGSGQGGSRRRPPRAPGEESLGPAPEVPPTDMELARGQPIAAIDFAGNQRVSQDDIMTYLREKVGQLFRPEELTRDVRELWEAGYFDDIQVDLTRGDDGVHLRFILRERSNIAQVSYDGNTEIETEKLEEGAEIKPNTILSYPAIRRTVQKLRDMYAEKGYFLAEVDFEVSPQPNNEVIIKFHIKEHEQVSVRRVTFIGNEHVTDDELREVMYTGQSGFFSFGSGGAFRQDAFERDVLMINAMYYDRGYLSVQVAAPRVNLTPDRTGIEVTITLNEGPQYRIRRLRIWERDDNGKEVEPLGGRRRLREMVHAKSGDVFKRAELAHDLQSIRTLYRDEGFANVEADPETKLDPANKLVDVVVPIRRGPPVHIERIEIRGNTKTRDKVIRREMYVQEGQLFSETKLEDSRKRIIALGYFERVDLSTEEGSAPDKVKVNIEVQERPTGTFQVGAGFSSIENFIATAQVQQANLFGNGQSLALQAQVSGLRQLINIRFFEPYFLDSDFSMALDLYDQLRIYNDFSQTSIGGAVTWGYALVRPTTFATLTYTGQLDRVSTVARSTFLGTSSAISVFQRLPLANLFNDGFTSSLRPALTYDTRDNRLFPKKGVYLRGSVELASPYFGTENEFLRYNFTGHFYYPIGAGFVIKLNESAGYVTSPKEQGVPIFARFFLGGIFDVRGFRLRTIGPRLPLASRLDPNAPPIPNGANIGGNFMFYQNLELEIPIIEKVGVRGVIFTDAGNAWNTESLYCNAARGQTAAAQSLSSVGVYKVNDPCFTLSSLTHLRTSWGFGIRWFSPLGPLRFEWGFPYKPLPYEESSVFEFTIGNFF